ncbi:MAG: TetR/AcrR family transcriptional regulator [Clostridia bacterium]|nr:TetR/AcrR family transcriptional regulator [Clostridia bacterium]
MDKAERTKKYIIEKASPIFNRRGYHGTSLSDLTEATKLTKGSIYGNFDNKDDLAINCFLFNVDKITDEIKSKIAAIKNPIEKLYVFPNVYRRIYKSILDNGGCPIANTLIEADDTHPLLNNLAIDVIHGLECNIASIIEEGKASGEIIETVKSQKTAQVIITLFEGGIILAKATGKDSFIIGAIEQVESIIGSLER